MNALMSMPDPGEMALWRIVDPGRYQAAPQRRRSWAWRTGVFSLGLAITSASAVTVWHDTPPDTIVRTRIVADGAEDRAGRGALSDMALRVAFAQGHEVALQQDAGALIITAQAHDAADARQRSTLLVDAILNASGAGSVAAVAGEPPAADPHAALRAERDRLATAAEAADARATAISTSLASLARDIASAGRMAADRRPGRDTLDKGQAALADLQLKRLQLVTKYQDTYPAVLVMDVQIHDLQKFLGDEARRVDAHPAAPDPSDALLAGERDRLRSELSQIDDRRRDLAATLRSLDLKLAALPVVTAIAPAPVAPPAPVLIATATTIFPAPDGRLTTVPAVFAGGLLLSGFAALWPRRRRSLSSALPHGLLLQAVPSPRTAEGRARTLPAPGWMDDRFVPSLESLQAE